MIRSVFLAAVVAAVQLQIAPRELPTPAVAQLAASKAAARKHARHVWRDTPPVNRDGTINAYVEIPFGEKRKFEFDMRANVRRIDRVMPDTLGGYPINYGYVPQTVSYDGDPFDVLVLGPALPGGTITRGVSVGLMHMEDEKGLDSKIVISPLDAGGRPRYALTADVRDRVQRYFARYKQHEPGKFSKVPGWGTAEEGRAFVDTTHAFFLKCPATPGVCRLQ